MRQPVKYFSLLLPLNMLLGLSYPAPLQADDDQLSEIIVTARKREEPLSQLSQQITVYDSEKIDSLGIDSVSDYSFLTPSLNFINTGNAAETLLTMRGVGSLGLGEPSIGYFVDGIYLGADSYISEDLFDIERIEILQGPEPALYGKSTSGGVINIISKPPAEVYGTDLKITLEDGYRLKTNWAISGPLAPDNLLGRLSVNYEDFDGYYTNTFNGGAIDENEELGLRASLLYSPSRRLRITPTLHLRKQDQLGFSARVVDDSRDYEGHPYNRNDLNNVEIQTQRASLKVEYDFPNVLFTSISAINNNDEMMSADLDYTAAPIFFINRDTERMDYSQELRLSSQGNGPFSWQAGSYFYKRHDDSLQILRLEGKDGFPISTIQTNRRALTYSLFGQGDYTFSEKFTFSAGLRMDHDIRKISRRPAANDRSFTNLSPKLSLSYKATNELSLYSSYALSRRPGGFGDGDAPEFEEEYTQAMELGMNGQWSNQLSVNAAVFYTLVKDQQVFDVELETLAQFTTNKGDGEIRGVEFQSTWLIRPDLSISAAATVLDAQFKDFSALRLTPTGVAQVDMSGNKLQFVPDYETIISADYTPSLGVSSRESFTQRFHLEARFTGELQWDDLNEEHEQATQIVNASYEISHDKWALRLFVDNIFDEEYFSVYFASFRLPFLGGNSLGLRGRERHYGASFKISFD